MTKLLTPHFRTYLARQFVKSIAGKKRTLVSRLENYINQQYVLPYYTENLNISIDDSSVDIIDSGYLYVFAGANTDWSNTTIPTPDNSVQGYHYNIYDSMLFGKKVEPEDVSYMISRYDWVSNTTFAQYDHENIALDKARFFTVVEEGDDYHVFKCIDNNNASPSVHKPSAYEYNALDGSVITTNTFIASSNYYYKTTDDYVWMYVYSIPKLTFNKFATQDYIPLTRETATILETYGAIKGIDMVSNGAYHIGAVAGNIRKTNVLDSSVTFWVDVQSGKDLFYMIDFYKGSSIYIIDGRGAGQIRNIVSSKLVGEERQIVIDAPFTVTLDGTSRYQIAPGVVVTGDGTECTARPVIDSFGRITQIDIVNSGKNYTYANVEIVTNTGYFDANNVFVKTNTVATARALISPPSGHGRDLINELFADKVCISVDFVSNNHPFTQFAQYGLIVDPLFKTANLTVSDTSGFLNGEILLQQDTATYGVISSIDSNSSILVVNNIRGSYEVSLPVIGISSNTEINIASINSNGNKFIVDQIVDNSGEILLIKNDPLTTRTDGQTERIKLIVDF
jgi:hypothetical protein